MSQRTSIFAQRMKMQREQKASSSVSLQNSNSPLDVANVLGEKSFIVSGTEAQEIHEENMRKLARMTQEQIAQERDKLMSELNPQVLAFIKSRRSTNSSKPMAEPMDTTEIPNKASEEIKLADTNATEDVQIEEVKELANKYPHMDVIEKEKLQWIGELPIEVNPPSDPYPARFNFEGELLPYADKGEGVLQGLHNHGEEPERPGYTLQELIQLSRSSVLQQRVISLNTLAKIMANASRYDECFSEPILPALLEADTFLLLRFSLDDPASPIVMASASALSNLITNHEDEACLDSLLGTPLGLQQPSLGVVLEMKQSDIDELKDQQLLKLDIIRGALRTDLLQRIKFILKEMNPEPVEIKQLIKALIRISRHSFEMANAVFNCPGLLEAVRSLLDVHDSSSYYPEALKLFRIISSRSRTLAANIVEKYEIQKPIFNFIAGDKAVGHPEAMHLALESFYTWQSFLAYNIATETIGALSPVLMRLAETHFGLTNIDGSRLDLEHGAALVSTIAIVAKLNFGQVNHILPLLLQATVKWLSQYINTVEAKFSASKLLGCCLTLFASTMSDFDSSSVLIPIIEKMIQSPGFSKSIKKMRKSSWLINGKIISSPENLPCLGCISPTVKEECSLPLIYSLGAYIFALQKSNLTEQFLGSNDLLGYLKTIMKGDNISRLCGHWYARQELNFLVILVHLFTSIDMLEHQSLFHKLAFRLLTSVQTGDKTLLPDIVSKTIFNNKFFSLDVDHVMKKFEELKLNDSSPDVKIKRYTLLEEAIKSLPDIEELYIQELGLQGLMVPWPPVTLTGILNSTQSALPMDWPFLPILRLYERQGADKNAISIVTRSLQWFIIIEEILPEVFSLDYTAKYCRLCCVYLAGSDLFQDVSNLLEASIHYILKHKEELDFEKDIPGLTSFYDFFREVLEHYDGVSYGNTTFGQYVLLPLQQRHSTKYKKLIWSELAAVLRILRTPVNVVVIRDYLEPCESDFNLLKTYLHALGTGKIREVCCPVLYRVAVHHVAIYVKTNSDKASAALMSMINSLGNQELKNLLLNYNNEFLQ